MEPAGTMTPVTRALRWLATPLLKAPKNHHGGSRFGDQAVRSDPLFGSGLAMQAAFTGLDPERPMRSEPPETRRLRLRFRTEGGNCRSGGHRANPLR